MATTDHDAPPARPQAGEGPTRPGDRPPPAGEPSGRLADFVRSQAALIGAVGGLAGLATFVANQPLGWAGPYLRFLLLGGALLVWLELVNQWPDALRMDRPGLPRGASWRMVGFAYTIQMGMAILVASILWRAPEILAPALVLGVGVLAWRYLERREHGRPDAFHRRLGPFVSALILVLACELLMELVSPTYRSLFEHAWIAVERIVR